MTATAPAALWTPPLFHSPAHPGALSRGQAVIDFTEATCTVLKGPLAGRPMRWLRWQRWLAGAWYELNPDGTQRYREGLVGVGRQNGKSLPSAGMALEALYRGPDGSEVYSAAGDRQQARIVFGEARKQVEKSPVLSKHARLYRDAIEIPDKGNVYRVLSSDAKLQQGLSPYFCVFDEVHVQRNDELWNAMRFGMAARPNAMLLGITTAGEHEDTLCGQMYEYGKRVAEAEIDDDRFFFAWWEPADRLNEKGQPVPCDVDDRQAWHEANPSLVEGVLDEAELEGAALRSNPQSFRRYRLNQWVGHGGTRWMDMSAWDDCGNSDLTLPPRTRVALTFDGSVDDDATALSVVRLDLDVPAVAASFVWERTPGDPEDWKVDRAEVSATVDRLFAELNVRKMLCDPAYWRSEIQDWQDRYGGKTVLEWPVTDARMGPAVTETYKRVKERNFMHHADPTVRRHVRNAVTKPTRAGHLTIRKQSPKSEFKIDAAVTVCMGVDAWLRYSRRSSTMRSI